MRSVRPLLLGFLLLFPALALYAQTAPPPVDDEPITPPAVVYPADAKAKQIQGTVVLEVHVSETGAVTTVKAISGPPELQQAAIDAYRLASYKPILRAGKPVPAVVTTKVEFSLHQAPPTPDELLLKEFEPVHRQCEALNRARDADAVTVCRKALDIAGRFTPTGQMVPHAIAYNDMALALLQQKKEKEAADIGDEAVVRIADVYPDSLAAANAYMTRAETRAHVRDIKGSIADCEQAERILRGLIEQQRAPYLAEDMKSQLKGVLRLHAVLLRSRHEDGKAKALEAEADKI